MDLRTRSGESAANGLHARESEAWTYMPNGFGLVYCPCGLLVILNKGMVDNSEMSGVEDSGQRKIRIYRDMSAKLSKDAGDIYCGECDLMSSATQIAHDS